ncbi:MAG: hypothetical protein K8R67_08185 [Desulfobacteraceae bacterium]|nr:hypothetical protein [Desulfobacteraceae bacterium]
MIKKIQISGLCINCLNVDKCSYRVNHTKPIIFCEEFSCSDPSEIKNTAFKAVSQENNSIISISNGICCNCENIEICNLQKTDQNVMHCEEYR